jgi:SSS family solute:Na+ symporter
VNAPLFGTFLLGMFWKRTTGDGAFYGLIAGTVAAAIHHGLTMPKGAADWIKGGWLSRAFGMQPHVYPVEMAQNFRAALWAFAACILVTVVVSLATPRTKTDEELTGLVYSLTPKIKDRNVPWYEQPVTLGIIALLAVVVLNLIFI